MDWIAEIQARDIAPGTLVLFVQDGHVDGDPAAKLAPGDQFYVVFPNNTRRAGMVASREPLSATITIGADRWRIEPVTTAMVAAPTALPSQGWRFVEKLV